MPLNVHKSQPDDPYKVWEWKALVKRTRRTEAEDILERVAKQVQPLMKRKGWKVKMLREFYPNNPGLLGLNVGKGIEIKVRLRPPGAPDSFFPYEHILGTMLHELCHNVIGPHNAAFYKLLDEITDEVERDMANGVFGTGEGFDARSTGRLGGKGPVPIHNPPSYKMRESMLKAAEQRMKKQQVMSSGPQKLGGSSEFSRGLTPAQAAAKAAERRIKDDMWCPTDQVTLEGIHLDDETMSESSVERDGTNAASTCCSEGKGSPEIIDLTSEEDGNTCCKRKADDSDQTCSENVWICKICTLENNVSSNVCAACATERTSRKKPMRWTCKFCTLENALDKTHCEACNQWRYSHGAPLSSSVKWNLT